MSIINMKPFEYLHKDGNFYIIEAEIWYVPPVTCDKYSSDCPSDLYGEFEVVDYTVLNEDGVDVSDKVYIEDRVFERQFDIYKECNQCESDLEDRLDYHKFCI